MTLDELLALFHADADDNGERTQAAVKVFISIRDYPGSIWIIPSLGDEDTIVQANAAEAIAARFGRRIQWPDNGEGSAHLHLAECE